MGQPTLDERGNQVGSSAGDDRPVNPVVRFSVERRVTMAMCVLGVLVLGWLSLDRLPLEFLPSFTSSHITVTAPYPSSSPEETERLIVRPLEDILGTVNGIDSLEAMASSSSGSVTLGFVDGTDMDLAAVEVRDRVDRVRNQLPDDLDRVFIQRFQSTDIPVLRFDLSAPWQSARLYDFTENIFQRHLERLDGVADVSVSGLQSAQIQVNLIPGRLIAHGVDQRELSSLLRANNLSLSGGTIREGSRALLVRVPGDLRTLEEIRALPVNERGLRLGDLAEVELAFPEKTRYGFLNGAEALSVSVYKSSTANLLEVVRRVRAEVEAVRGLESAEGLQVNYYFDSSEDVRKGLAELRNTGLLGGLLAVAFIFLFLRRLRTTLLAAIAIPVSVVVTFVIMYLSRQLGWTDLTLNIMSLMGLMLAIGMLVDSSIVVIESIYRHRQALGEDARTAALAGASEVALPIGASTVTTACVFMPIVFLSSGGRFATFMQNIGLTIILVITASMVVAVTVVPMVAAMLLEREPTRPQPLFDRFSAWYGRILRFTLRHRLIFTVLAVALLLFSWNLYQGIERSFGPPSFERQLSLQVDVPKSFSVEQKQELYQRVYDLLDAHREELEIQDISYGFQTGSGRSRGRRGTNRFILFLTDEEHSRLDTGEIRDRVQALLPSLPGVSFTSGRAMRGRSGSGESVEVMLSGDRLEILELLSERVVSALEMSPSLSDVDSSLESGDEEIRLRPDPERTLQAGLSSQIVGSSVAAALSSRRVTTVETSESELEVIMQYREEDRQTLDQLEKLPVAFGANRLAIGSLAEFERAPGARTISREDRQAVVKITGDTASGVPSFAATGAVQGVLQGMSFPGGYAWEMGADFRESGREESSAIFMLLLALALVYMTMAALFESFAQPFTIMLSVPFAFVGVGLIMRLVGQPRDRMSDMGLIILAGIVVNNAIVLVDHINRLRRSGMSRDEAIVLGGQHRFRPIVMTAATTILGLSPMVAPFFLPQIFGAVEGRAAFWAPVGLVTIAGLTTSTFFTLTVIPTLYSLMDDLVRLARSVAREVAR